MLCLWSLTGYKQSMAMVPYSYFCYFCLREYIPISSSSSLDNSHLNFLFSSYVMCVSV